MKTCLSLLLLPLASAALALNDPTLPPPALRASAPASGVAAAAPAAALRLQGLRPGVSALIDGQLRRPGERWQGHQLLRVDDQVAWLRDPEGRLLRLSLLAKPAAPSRENRP
jgi:hypothetical protein